MQFFATVDEIAGLIAPILNDGEIVVTVVTQQPLKLESYVGRGQLENSKLKHIFFSPLPLKNSSGKFMDLQWENDVFSLVIMTAPPNLHETFLGGSPESEAMKEALRRMKYRVRKMTKAGMHVKVEGNPIEGYAKNHRYSPGAEDVLRQGHFLVAVSGKHRFSIPAET